MWLMLHYATMLHFTKMKAGEKNEVKVGEGIISVGYGILNNGSKQKPRGVVCRFPLMSSSASNPNMDPSSPEYSLQERFQLMAVQKFPHVKLRKSVHVNKLLI